MGERQYKQGIFVAEVRDGRVIDRYVVVADSAERAVLKVAAFQWPQADMNQRAEMVEEGRIELGRLGDYDPGITGASMSRGAVIAVQRIGR